MPSVTYMNQSAPFWDFVASLEQQGRDHPLFAANNPRGAEEDTANHEQREEHQGAHHPPPHPPHGSGPFGAWAPWAQGWGDHVFGGGDGLPHRGPPPYQRENGGDEKEKEKDSDEKNEKDMRDDERVDNGEGASRERGDGPAGHSDSDNEGFARGPGRHGRCGREGGRRGRCGGPGGPGGFSGRGGWGHHRGGPHGWGGRGRWAGPWGRGGFFGGGGERGFDPSTLAAHFWSQFADRDNNNTANEDRDHVPNADIFDTPAAYIVHLSLPGAQKPDINVSYSAEISELHITGVVHRPAECDEEFLKHLAVSEREVGVFERKIRLGTRATPAAIDVEGITAKLMDGILRVEVPKLGEGDFVEVRKVDVL